MMKRLFVSLIIVMGLVGCAAVVSEEPTDQTVNEPTTSLPEVVQRQGIALIHRYEGLEDIISPLLRGIPTTTYQEYDETLLDEVQELIIIYDETLFEVVPLSLFGVEELQPNQIVTRLLDRTQLVSLIYPQDESTVEGLLRQIRPWMLEQIGQHSFEVFSSIQHVNDSSRLSDLDVCRLETNLRHQDGSRRGFPYAAHKTIALDTVRIAVIPLDFPSYQGDPASIERIHEDLLEAVVWSENISGGKMRYELVFVDEWLTLPYDQEYYPVYGVDAFSAERQSRQAGLDQAFLVADPFVDFSTIDFVYFYFPYESVLNQQTSLYGVVNTTTPRTQIRNLDVFGLFQKRNYEDNQYWTHFVHEVLHSQGFVGHGPCMFCPYSIMTDDWGYAKGILTWEGFLADWYDETQLNCVDSSLLEEPLIFKLDSIDTLAAAPGDSNLMVKLSDTKMMVIEYRSTGRYSTLPPEFQGIFIYVMDLENGSQYPQNSRLPQLENDKDNHWYVIYPTDATRGGFSPFPFVHSVNQEVTYDGVHIRVLSTNVVEVSKVT